MADEKTFTESEHLAVLADRVSKETASLTAELDQLRSEKAEIQNKLDAAESAKLAAEDRAKNAEQELAQFKAEVEQEREQAARKDVRVAALKEAASHLTDEFFTEERVTRIVAMTDEDFEAYAADLKVVAVKAPETASVGAPRESAMAGAPAAGAPKSTSAAEGFLLGRFSNKEG